MSVLAAGLAELVRPEFAWANCSGSTTEWERSVVSLLERGSSGRRADPVEPADFQPLETHPEAIAELVDPETLPARMRERLFEFVGLPPLLQRLVSTASTPGDRVSVVLTNVDGLPPLIVQSTFESSRVHEVLHREGITLLVTFRGNPSSRMQEPFDQVYRVEQPFDGPWVDSKVRSERGPARTELLLPKSLRESWTTLGLNPWLLPD